MGSVKEKGEAWNRKHQMWWKMGEEKNREGNVGKEN